MVYRVCMGLVERILDHEAAAALGEDPIPVHSFYAVLGEFEQTARSGVTAAKVFSMLNLSASEQSQLVTWYQTVYLADNWTAHELHRVLLARDDGRYTLAEAKARLGL